MNATSQISKIADELSRKNASDPMRAMMKKLFAHAKKREIAKTPRSAGDRGTASPANTSATTAIGDEIAARSGSAARFSALYATNGWIGFNSRCASAPL